VKAFAYVNAANEKEAIAALGPERGRMLPLAGGMDLLALMKDYVAQPERLVNVKNLDRTVAKTPDGGLRIGAAVTLAALAQHADVRRLYPALAEAAAEVGTPQIRNVGTLGGNLNQRPRCWYFRNEEFPCLKKGGARCFAVDGENQFHAIFGERSSATARVTSCTRRAWRCRRSRSARASGSSDLPASAKSPPPITT